MIRVYLESVILHLTLAKAPFIIIVSFALALMSVLIQRIFGIYLEWSPLIYLFVFLGEDDMFTGYMSVHPSEEP